MNVARVHADANRWTLEELLTDPDTSPFIFQNIDATSPQTLGAKSVVSFPDNVQVAENASRIIHVDLDDPLQMWNTERFFQQIQGTSWHDELGDPPVHGLMWINEANSSLIWWDREADSLYMQFDTLNSYMLANTAVAVNDLTFLDGIIFVAHANGAAVLDLVADRSVKWATSGVALFQGNITDRNTANGHLLMNASPAIVNNTVNDIAAVRDPELTDEFGRPKHLWAVGTDGGGSVYSPVDDAIYDTSFTDDADSLSVSNDGVLTIGRDDSGAGRDLLYVQNSIFGISADGWLPGPRISNVNGNAFELAWADADKHRGIRFLDGRSWAQQGSPQILIPSPTGGLYISHFHTGGDGDSALIRLHADYASPYMKGDIRACWPGHSTADVSPAGHTLTNNNSVTFPDGGPAGSYADFVAASSMSLELADHADMGAMAALTLILWFYRDIDSGAAEGLLSKYDQGDAADQSFILGINASDQVYASTDTSAGDVTSTGPAISLATYYMLALVYDGVNQTLYLQGEQVDQDAQTGTIDNSTEKLFIGSESSGDVAQNFFDGRIGGVSISATAMTQREIRAEYQRGLRRINSTIDTNDTIEATDVDAVAVDPHGKYFAVVSGDKVTIFDELAVPVAIDAAPAGSLRDVAIKSMPGAGDPHYALGTSTRVELVQPDLRILG